MPKISPRHSFSEQDKPKVPTLPFLEYPWYAGGLEREVAEQKLMGLPDGTFLVRDSERVGGFALSVSCNGFVKHIKVMMRDDGSYILSDVSFRSLQELVDHYTQNMLAPTFPGIETTLKVPFKTLLRHSPLPPAAGRRYQIVGIAVAMYDFAARDTTRELSIKQGDRINIISKAGGHKGWWKGELDGRSGHFPADYVEEIDCPIYTELLY